MRTYFTTPIYYVNDTPHIGHSYTTIVTDVLIRYRKLFGDNTLFLTGTDEHGQKVQAAAEKRGIDPQLHCDEMVVNFKNIWKELKIQNDIFIRTTDSAHKSAVQNALQTLWEKSKSQPENEKEIYAKEYEGWYSVSEEIFYTEKDLVNGKTPSGNEVTRVKEKNYFFRMSKYQDQLINYIQKNPKFIQPEAKKNEVLGFLRQPLHDLCISRPKSRLSWGIELPFDTDYVTYVWFDALLNYTNAVGFQQNGPANYLPETKRTESKIAFQTWWSNRNPIPNKIGSEINDPQVVHFIGKDILMTHAVYWPTMLMALSVPLPSTIFAHGWWLTESGEKMSKSKGPVIKPLDVKNIVGVDPLRYFLTRDIQFGNDAAFSVDLVLSRVNSDLANNFGNLLSRSASILHKFCDGKIPACPANFSEEATQLVNRLAGENGLGKKVEIAILNFEPHAAAEMIMDVLADTNKFFSDRAPWSLFKTDRIKAEETMYVTYESLRICSALLLPIMPDKATEVLARLGYSAAEVEKIDIQFITHFQKNREGQAIVIGEPVFPRVENK